MPRKIRRKRIRGSGAEKRRRWGWGDTRTVVAGALSDVAVVVVVTPRRSARFPFGVDHTQLIGAAALPCVAIGCFLAFTVGVVIVALSVVAAGVAPTFDDDTSEK